LFLPALIPKFTPCKADVVSKATARGGLDHLVNTLIMYNFPERRILTMYVNTTSNGTLFPFHHQHRQSYATCGVYDFLTPFLLSLFLVFSLFCCCFIFDLCCHGYYSYNHGYPTNVDSSISSKKLFIK
jgi:hypothetical protein